MIVLPNLTVKDIMDLVRLGDELLCIKFDCGYTTVGKAYQVAGYIDSEDETCSHFPKNGLLGYRILDDEEDPDGLLEVDLREMYHDHLYYPMDRISEEDMFAISLGMEVKVA